VTELATSPAAEPSAGNSPRLTYLVKRLEMAERARMEEVLQTSGVTLHQYTALSLLERRDGLSSAQLARRHYVTPQAMNQLVATLERDGLIHREPDAANRKILRATLTDRGRTTLESCHAAVDELERQMLADFTPDQKHEFRAALLRSLRGLADSP
jgi:DNA-binding MarR family transcriptional regulator